MSASARLEHFVPRAHNSSPTYLLSPNDTAKRATLPTYPFFPVGHLPYLKENGNPARDFKFKDKLPFPTAGWIFGLAASHRPVPADRDPTKHRVCQLRHA